MMTKIRLVLADFCPVLTTPVAGSVLTVDSQLGHRPHAPDAVGERALGNDRHPGTAGDNIYIDGLPAFRAPFIQRSLDVFVLGTKDSANGLDAVFPVFELFSHILLLYSCNQPAPLEIADAEMNQYRIDDPDQRSDQHDRPGAQE